MIFTLVFSSLFFWLGLPHFTMAAPLPHQFIHLRDIAPTILQDIRYAGYHNFVGYPLPGYDAAECILTKKAAHALAQVQHELLKSKLSLKVYDCYRPQRAVNAFIQWADAAKQQDMKAEFYPRLKKKHLFTLHYIAKKSGHSRGSTVDLTVVRTPTFQQANFHRGQRLVACFSPVAQRFADNSLDMGTGYDCLDPLANPLNQQVSVVAFENRMLLRKIMKKYGFQPSKTEWWHFTSKNEPFPHQYFDFRIQS